MRERGLLVLVFCGSSSQYHGLVCSVIGVFPGHIHLLFGLEKTRHKHR